MVTKLPDTIKRYTSISATIDILSRRQLALLDPQTWDDRNDRYFMGLYKEYVNARALYGACFTQVAETYHHWRVFGGGADGACLEFRRTDFENHIKRNHDIRNGEVEYLKLTDTKKLHKEKAENLPFMKRIGFEPEAEYRVIAISDQPQAPVLGVPIDLKLIRQVFINPWLADSIYQSIKSVLQRIDGCSQLKISRSSLIDSLRWKNAGNELVGKSKVGRPVLGAGTGTTATSKPARRSKSKTAR
jgi:hypothetical protein